MSSYPVIVYGVSDLTIRLWELLPDIEVMINNLSWRWGRPPAKRVWVDSGGYQIMTKGMNVSLADIIRRYRSLDVDIYMSLDIPPKELCKVSKGLVLQNIKNFEYIYTKLEDKKIVPIVHCYPPDLLLEAIDTYRSYNVDMLGFGGAVPPALAKFGKGSRILPLIALAITVKSFKGWVHALGIGGASAMYNILKTLSVRSFDSSAWRIKAAYGKIIVPGLGERYVGNGRARFGKTMLRDQEYEILIKALQKSSFPYIDKLDEILRSFTGRALVNAWILFHYANEFSPKNGFRWMLQFSKELSEYSVTELIDLMERYRTKA